MITPDKKLVELVADVIQSRVGYELKDCNPGFLNDCKNVYEWLADQILFRFFVEDSDYEIKKINGGMT